MSFIGNEGGVIDLTAGEELTANFRRDYPNAIKAHFVGREHLEALLAQDGAMGVRIFHGVDDTGAFKLVLVAADANEDDMLDMVVDKLVPCPSQCGTRNGLNS